MDVLQRGAGFTLKPGSDSLERLQLQWRPACRHYTTVGTASSCQVSALTSKRAGTSFLSVGDCSSSRNWHLSAADQHSSNVVSSDQGASASSGKQSAVDGEEGCLLTYVAENGPCEPSLTEELRGGEDWSWPEPEISDAVGLTVEKTGKNKRRIVAKVSIGAPLEAVWGILTAYEKLADFIPGLAVSELLERGEGRALLRQVGQQDLAFGIKFKAEAVMEVTEHPPEVSNGTRRLLDFEMVKGDFELFSGTWGMEQKKGEAPETTLSYTVDVQPKPWLPVGLLEGRLSKDIKLNLICVRDAAVARVA